MGGVMMLAQAGESAFRDYAARSRAQAQAYWEHRMTEAVPLSIRAFKGVWTALVRKGIDEVAPARVAQLRAKDLMAEEDFGRASLVQVKAWLASYGLMLREAT